jgi:hypothetical protein
MTAILLTPSAAEPEDVLDDGTPEDRLQAALRVHGGDLLELAGQATEQMQRDGKLSPWLRHDIGRAILALNAAWGRFAKETDANV